MAAVGTVGACELDELHPRPGRRTHMQPELPGIDRGEKVLSHERDEEHGGDAKGEEQIMRQGVFTLDA